MVLLKSQEDNLFVIVDKHFRYCLNTAQYK